MYASLMPKRGSEDLLVHSQANSAAALLAMTAASEPKKPKLDSSLAAFAAAFPNGNSSALLFGGLPSVSNVPTALQSASNAASIAANALLNYQPTASSTLLAPTDPSGNPISKVVHLRNIPSDMSELELIHFCLPFGKIYNYLMLKGKNQAFVEYEDESGAQAITQIAHAYPMAIRGKTIFCQYSTHQELKTERKVGKNDLPLLADPSLLPSLSAAVKQQSGTKKRAHSPDSTPLDSSPQPLAQSSLPTAIAQTQFAPSIHLPIGVGTSLLAAQTQGIGYGAQIDAWASKRQRLAPTTGVIPTSIQQLLMAATSPLRQFNQLPVTASTVGSLQLGATTNDFQYGSPANLLVSGQSSNATTPVSTSASQLDISTQQQPNSVLRVIVDNMLCAVTLDQLHSLFSRYGKILRIITFAKNHTFQALIQFSEAQSAQNARSVLDGQNIYTGCCTLRIDYSKLTTLSVRYNNDKSRDYTNPLLPTGELSFEQQLSLATQNQLGSLVPGVFSLPASVATNGIPTSFYTQSTGITGADALTGTANVAAQANAALAPFLGGLSGAANLAALAAASNGVNSLQAASTLNTANTLLQQQLGGLLAITPVVLVSNLDENKVQPDALFTLFGVYGDVQRVKILFNKKDNALIQYAEPQQAQLAIQHLDKIRWHGKVVRVAPSKHTNVQMPKEDVQSNLTRDYQNSALHRFKKPGSKNYLNIYPPSSTLHLSNIPPSITEEFLKSAFIEKGFNVKEFQFFQRDHKMALLQLDDVETAIDALIVMHNYRLAENAHLRVSFSKKGLKI
ncbi:Protein CBR-PTB-1 [Aphelenchoides besseyi]|nr:Protein CBR-PTB-1 [Aphelenchoides besseyi]